MAERRGSFIRHVGRDPYGALILGELNTGYTKNPEQWRSHLERDSCINTPFYLPRSGPRTPGDGTLRISIGFQLSQPHQHVRGLQDRWLRKVPTVSSNISGDVHLTGPIIGARATQASHRK